MKRRIRVAFGTPVDRALTNAQCINAREIASRLNPETFDLALFCLGPIEGVEERLANRPRTHIYSLWRHAKAFQIAKTALTWADVFFYPNTSPVDDLIRIARRLGHPIKVVFQVETSLPVPEWIRPSQTAMNRTYRWIREADMVTGVSERIAEYLRVTLLRSDAICMPIGVDWTLVENVRNRPAEERERMGDVTPRVLFAGSLKERKRPSLLLDAAAQFPFAQFRLVGDGPLRESLERRVAEERLSNVTLVGALENGELLSEMCNAEVFFFPSVHEGLPRVLVEAGACGLPTICRNDYGTEAIAQGLSGVAVGSDAELFRALKELLESPERRRAMGTAGIKHASQFAWERIVHRWESVLADVARA